MPREFRILRRSPASLVTRELHDPNANVLIVTNLWPRVDKPNYGVFVKRQVDSLRGMGVRCDVLFVRGYRSQFAYPLLAFKLLVMSIRPKHRYSLVHSHGGELPIFARFYLRVPLLASFCGDDLIGTPRADGTVAPAHRIKAWLLRQLSRAATATITKSAEMERLLPSGVARRNTVLPNGVDRELFAARPRDEARAELGWRVEDRVVLFAADPQVARKRYWLARDAVSGAGLELDDVRMEVGSGVAPTTMPVLMSAADCLILTSVSEGSPNVVKEALAVDLPVVSTSAGDVAELLKDVEPSEVCPSDPAALAAALVTVLSMSRRSNGRQRSQHLDGRVTAAKLVNLYEELARPMRGDRRTAAAVRNAAAARQAPPAP